METFKWTGNMYMYLYVFIRIKAKLYHGAMLSKTVIALILLVKMALGKKCLQLSF